MTLLQVENFSKEYGATSIFSGVAFQLAAGDKVGLFGANGAGKTTLLRCMTGQEHPDSGRLVAIGGAALGYLEQEWMPGKGLSLWQAAAEVLEPILQMEEKMRALENLMREQSDVELEVTMQSYAELSHKFEMMGGFQAESELRSVLFGLGFSESDLAKPAEKLSGGERIRLQLGRILFEKPPVLLLDEPTNHLDLQSTEWLEQYLSNYPGAMLLVSHDREFLDHLCNRIFSLVDGCLHQYTGNYQQYLEQEQARHELQLKLYQKQQKDVQKLESFINKFGAGTRASQAQSRKKQLERMELMTEPVQRERSERFRLAVAANGVNEVLTLQRLQKNLGGRQLFGSVTNKVHRGDRVAIIGPNGSGKSTFLKVMIGELPADDGNVIWGAGIRVGYFSQNLDRLDDQQTVLEEMLKESELTYEDARALLARFQLRDGTAEKKVAALSGGQRNRLTLAKLVASPAHVLLLDEPTNHLDIFGRQALEEALLEFPGTILFVSHDRYLVKKLATRIWSLENGRLQEYDSYEDYRRTSFQKANGGPEKMEKNREQKEDARRKKRQAQRANRQRELERSNLEQAIAELEGQMRELSEKLSQPKVFQTEEGIQLSKKYEQIQKDLQNAYDRWILIAEEPPDEE